MALWLLAINGLMFAILLLVILLPALHIHPLGLYPDDDEEPPRAGELVAGTHLRRTEKQKLYLLFIIPSCAIVNSVFLYLTYYRPIRFIQYRVEFNEVSLLTNRLLGQNKLMSIINANEHNRSASTINFNNASNFASPLMVLMRNNTTHLLSRHNSNDNNNNNNINTRVGGANNSSHAMGYANNSTTSNNNNNNNSSSYSFNNTGSSYINNTNNNNYYDNTLIGTIASQSFLKLNRHCRPKIVKKNEYVLKSIYPEVTELCRQVEKSFFIACTITERNFLTAIRKVLGPGVLREFTNHSLFGNSYLTMANYANVYGNGIGYNSSISKPTATTNNNNNNNYNHSNYVTKSYLDNSNSNVNKLITYNGNTTSTSTNNTNTTTNSTLNNNINNNIDNNNINNVNSAGVHETNGTYERGYNSNNPPRHRFTFLDRIMRNNNNNNNDNNKHKSNNKNKNSNTGINVRNDTFDEMSDFGLESATEAFNLGSHTANTNNHTQPFTGSHNKYYHGAHNNNHSSMNNTISTSNNNRLLHEPISDMNNINAPTLHYLQSRDPSVVLLVPTREARHEGHIRNTMPAAIHPHELNNARSSQNKNSSSNDNNNTSSNYNGSNNIIDSPIRIVAEEPFAHERTEAPPLSFANLHSVEAEYIFSIEI